MVYGTLRVDKFPYPTSTNGIRNLSYDYNLGPLQIKGRPPKFLPFSQIQLTALRGEGVKSGLSAFCIWKKHEKLFTCDQTIYRFLDAFARGREGVRPQMQSTEFEKTVKTLEAVPYDHAIPIMQ